jgi:prolyl-tRNA editing enzyme YbaK/EbsC (Cys-tRNA(Pro) deacylase)
MMEQSEEARLRSLRQLLDAAGARYEIFSHAETVLTAEDGVQQGVGRLDEMAPTLILETEKGLLAAILRGGTRLSYKKIKRELVLKNVALARAERVYDATGAVIGTVCLINPSVMTIIDARLPEVVYGGCGVPRHTLRIHRTDLIRVTQALVFDFADGTGPDQQGS